MKKSHDALHVIFSALKKQAVSSSRPLLTRIVREHMPSSLKNIPDIIPCFSSRIHQDRNRDQDYLADIYGDPGLVKLRIPASGRAGMIEDAANMASYFRVIGDGSRRR